MTPAAEVCGGSLSKNDPAAMAGFFYARHHHRGNGPMKWPDNNTLTSLSLAWIAFLGLTIWTFHSEGFEVWFPVALLISGAALIIGESIVLRFCRQSHSEDRGKLSADE
jgi:hypothetical protein